MDATPGDKPADSARPADPVKPAEGAAPSDGSVAPSPAPARAAVAGPSGEPLGFAGPSGIEPVRRAPGTEKDFAPIEDRWRVQFPEWNRYGSSAFDVETPYNRSAGILDPYNQNVLKGDYPILGNDIFLVLQGTSDSLIEGRSFPIPSGNSTAAPKSEKFFGSFDQFLYNQNFIVSAELFKGDTAFKPKELVVKATPVFNVNYFRLFENNAVNIDVRDKHDRLDGHVGMQEALIEYHLVDLSPNYDFLTVVGGVQPFNSDFRGFLFNDNNLGLRLQGNYASNRLQWNFAWFHQLEKDTNSGLNAYNFRNQNIFIANFFCQDFGSELSDKLMGYTLQLSYHCNLDESRTQYDTNGFLVRPSKIGFPSQDSGRFDTKRVQAHYLGWAGDGHIGPINLTHQYYLALGTESRNEITGKRQSILAQFFACEASVDVDWLRFKGSFLYSSGDPNPDNGRASGFDSILDNPFFAGAGFSYFNRQNIPLVQTGVQLVNRLSLIPDLRSSKTQGQANFVNPGLFLYNVGASAKITPKLFLDANVNFLFFDRTEVLEKVLVQNNIRKALGIDYSLGMQFRPLLTDNVILTAGVGALTPWAGFRDIYTNQTLYSTFVSITLTY